MVEPRYRFILLLALVVIVAAIVLPLTSVRSVWQTYVTNITGIEMEWEVSPDMACLKTHSIKKCYEMLSDTIKRTDITMDTTGTLVCLYISTFLGTSSASMIIIAFVLHLMGFKMPLIQYAASGTATGGALFNVFAIIAWYAGMPESVLKNGKAGDGLTLQISGIIVYIIGAGLILVKEPQKEE